MRLFKQIGFWLSLALKLGLLGGMILMFAGQVTHDFSYAMAGGLTFAGSATLLLLLTGVAVLVRNAESARTRTRMLAAGTPELEVQASRFAAGALWSGRLARYPDAIRFWGDEPAADLTIERTAELTTTALANRRPGRSAAIVIGPPGDNTPGVIFEVPDYKQWVDDVALAPRQPTPPAVAVAIPRAELVRGGSELGSEASERVDRPGAVPE